MVAIHSTLWERSMPHYSLEVSNRSGHIFRAVCRSLGRRAMERRINIVSVTEHVHELRLAHGAATITTYTAWSSQTPTLLD